MALVPILLVASMSFADDGIEEVEALLRQERYEEAAAAAAKLAERDGRSAVARLLLGRALLGRHDYKAAAGALTRAIELDRGNALARLHRGECYWALARDAEAVEDFKAAAALDPRNAEAHLWLGKSKLPQAAAPHPWVGAPESQEGSLDGALAEFEEAMRLDPNLAEASLRAANVHEAKGDRAGAVELWTRTVALDPRWGDAWEALGADAQARGDYPSALARFEKVLDLYPSVDALGRIIQVLHRMSRHADAEAYRARLIATERESGAEEIRYVCDRFEVEGAACVVIETVAKGKDAAASDFAFGFKTDGRLREVFWLRRTPATAAIELSRWRGDREETFERVFGAVAGYAEALRAVLDARAGKIPVDGKRTIIIGTEWLDSGAFR